MVNFIEKDKKKRKLFLKNLKKRSRLKLKLKDKNLDFKDRLETQFKINKLPKNSSKVRLKNRCVISGRSHSVLRIFKISRIKIRELIAMGLIPGVRKSSW